MPTSRIRGPGAAASIVAPRWLRTPPGCVERHEDVVVDPRPGPRARSSSAYTESGGPKSTIAWSIRWLPRSASSPPASSASGRSRQAPALTAGRQRSKRD